MNLADVNIIDILVVVIVVISTLVSIKRGFAKEAISLGVWVAAFFIAIAFNSGMQQLLEGVISEPSLRQGAAFLLLFILTLIVGSMVSYLVGELIKLSGLSTTDRILGMAFGFVRGMVIVIVMAVVLDLSLKAAEAKPAWFADSVLVPQLLILENWSRDSTADLLSWLGDVSGLKG